MLGDDIVIASDKLALRYKDIMSQFGVSISESKTHVSPTMYEFAKRWYYEGQEVSGIPIKGFQTVRQF